MRVVGDWPVRRDPGVKLGASALSLVDEERGPLLSVFAEPAEVGIVMGIGDDPVLSWGGPEDPEEEGAAPLTERDGGAVFVGEMVLRSAIIR